MRGRGDLARGMRSVRGGEAGIGGGEAPGGADVEGAVVELVLDLSCGRRAVAAGSGGVQGTP